MRTIGCDGLGSVGHDDGCKEVVTLTGYGASRRATGTGEFAAEKSVEGQGSNIMLCIIFTKKIGGTFSFGPWAES